MMPWITRCQIKAISNINEDNDLISTVLKLDGPIAIAYKK